MLDHFISNFIYMFAVIDPVGTVPVFIAVTKGFSGELMRSIAIKSVMIGLLVLTFFLLTGELILDAMSIPLSAFQLAGGVVLFLFAMSMIFGESKPDEEVRLAEEASETAVYPLAIPSIAGPGAMLAAVLLTRNEEFSIAEQSISFLAIICVLLITMILLLLATRIHSLIGNSGAAIISRVMGLILASVAASSILSAISQYFGLGVA